MRGKNYITINGKKYDAVTGLALNDTPAVPVVAPIQKPASRGRVMSDVGVVNRKPVSARTLVAATAAHQTPQHSQTLRRTGLKKPVVAQPREAVKTTTRSPHISRFGSVAPRTHSPLPAQHQPLAAALKKQSAPVEKAKQPLTGSQLKDELIKRRLRDVDTVSRLDKIKTRRYPRLATILTSVAAMIVLGGYLTYLNMPGLSMKIAATRADVAATYPAYNPTGYSFRGPVAFTQGEVKVNFSSNTNSYAYVVSERNSSWDSQALLDNYVTNGGKRDDYTTLQDSGLTIYIQGKNASWVNGGVMYNIDYSAAPLSTDQIQHIATSTL